MEKGTFTPIVFSTSGGMGKEADRLLRRMAERTSIKGGGGGYQAYFFGNFNFEIEVAQQGSYMYQHFGEVSGPRRPTGSEPRPALIWAPGIAIWLF